MVYNEYKYILKGRRVYKEADVLKWAAWFEKANRHVALTYTGWLKRTRVSTVFLGLDHNFSDKGRPLVFETLVFGGKYNGLMRRYPTYTLAERGHEDIVRMIEGKKIQPVKFITGCKRLFVRCIHAFKHF